MANGYRDFSWSVTGAAYTFAIALTLSPELEVRIQQKLTEGYRTVDELIEFALDQLDEVRGVTNIPALQSKIDGGWDAAERGDTISSEDFEAEMDQWRAKVNAQL
jgi:predicted transcriptional regulator